MPLAVFTAIRLRYQGGKGGFLLGGIHAAAGGCTVSIGGTLGIAGGGSIKVFILWLAMLVLADTDAIAAIHALFIGTHEITLLSVARATIKCLQEAEEPEQSRQHAQEAAEGAGDFDKRGFFLTGTYEDCYLPDDEAACWKDVENYARRVKYATCKRFGVEKEKIRLMLWAVLLTAAANAAALVPDTDRDSGQNVPTVLMEPQSEDERPEVVLDGSGTA